MKTVTILGATGSVGTSTLDLVERAPDQFRVLALTANNDVQGLAAAAIRTRAQRAVVADAAGPQAFVDFSALLFAAQPEEGGPGLSDDRLVALAEQAGAAGNRVADGIRDLAYEDWTRRVTDEASKAGLQGTPTIRVDDLPRALPGEAAPVGAPVR